MDPHLTVHIMDTFNVSEDRTAVCVRKFLFINSTDRQHSMPPLLSVDLPLQARDIKLSFNGQDYEAIPVEERPYNKTVQFSPNNNLLDSHSREEFYLKFQWDEFILDQETSKTEIRLYQPFSYNYSAQILPSISGIFPNAKMKFLPPDALNLESYVIARDDH